MGKPIRVLVIDDSAVVRKVMAEILNNAEGIEVMASALDPLFALEKMKREWPDVILLDIEMPRMDGLTFLKKIMSERPTPIVICSTLTANNSETAMQALAAGALSIITKPTLGLNKFLNDAASDVVEAVRNAANANMRVLKNQLKMGADHLALAEPRSLPAEAMSETTDKLIAIGTSTGGTQALEKILGALPRTVPGIVVVQHMPEQFTALFAQRLNQMFDLEIIEAQNGTRVRQGRVLIAPGGRHTQVKRSGAQYLVEVKDGPPVNRHKPSVDVLFLSVAKCAGRNALGVILTGMGDDGARGLLNLHETGAQTIAQDEDSSVVFGMPKEAIKLGGVDEVLNLNMIPAGILKFQGR